MMRFKAILFFLVATLSLGASVVTLNFALTSSVAFADERPRALTIPLEKTPPDQVQKAKIAKERKLTPTGPALLDARPSFDYATGHVIGALPIRWQDFAQTDEPHKGALDPDLALIARRLRISGVTPERAALVYGNGPKGSGEEGRVAWMLEYLGVKDVAVKNMANEKARKTTEETEQRWTAPIWIPHPNEDIRLRRSELENLIDNKAPVQLIDVRNEEEVKQAIKDKKLVPLKGSVNVPWTEFMTKDGEMLTDKDAVRKVLLDHKVNPDQDLIFLCARGVRGAYATVAALKAGLHAKNYDGGLIEWYGAKSP